MAYAYRNIMPQAKISPNINSPNINRTGVADMHPRADCGVGNINVMNKPGEIVDDFAYHQRK